MIDLLSNFSSTNLHLSCLHLEWLTHFGDWVPWILSTQLCAEKSQRLWKPGGIRLSPTSLSKQASAQYLWQPQSLFISTEPTCQIPPESNDTAYMWMRCDSIDRQKERDQKSARGNEKGVAWGRGAHPPTYQRSASRSKTHILGLGVTHCRNLSCWDVTLNNVPCYWPNIPVSLWLCSWLSSCGDSGTLKADVAYWGPSEGWTSSPQGAREADSSGTVDVTEMGNWLTGCTWHKVWDAVDIECALSWSQF